MKFFYSASVMGYGWGYGWHKKYNFPNFHRVTRTLTCSKKTGIPFAILKFGNSVWNRVGLHNMGVFEWLLDHTFYNSSMDDVSDITLSIAGTDDQLKDIMDIINLSDLNLAGVELNFSCPNACSFNNKEIPESKYPLYLKLNCFQDPYEYDLDNITGIRMNSVPGKYLGGWSGKRAQKYNWPKIKIYNYQGLNVAGCSVTSINDIKYLEEYCGCKEIGIGSIILTNPRFVEGLKGE